MIKTIRTSLAAGAFVWLTGCMMTDTGPSAEYAAQMGNDYLGARVQKDNAKTFEYYADDFFNMRSREQWQGYLNEINTKLGDLQKFELLNKQKDVRYSGTFYFLQYKTTYAHGSARELITLMQPVEGGALKIFAHKIEPKAAVGEIR